MKDLVIAIDFDGVIVANEYPAIGKVNHKMIDLIKMMQANNNKIILNTCRTGKYLDTAVEVCRKEGIIFDAVNENLPERIEQFGGDCRKISADYYIDDKNLDTYYVTDIPTTSLSVATAEDKEIS